MTRIRSKMMRICNPCRNGLIPRIPDFWELLLPVLGVEKYELLAKQAGNEDPFFL